MPDTTSDTASNAQAAFTDSPPVADLNTGTPQTVLRRVVLIVSKRTSR